MKQIPAMLCLTPLFFAACGMHIDEKVAYCVRVNDDTFSIRTTNKPQAEIALVEKVKPDIYGQFYGETVIQSFGEEKPRSTLLRVFIDLEKNQCVIEQNIKTFSYTMK